MIEQTTESQDSSGSVINTWSQFASVRSTYEPQSGSENMTEDHEQAIQSVKFRIRYLAGVTPKMRITYNGSVFDILSAIDYLGMRKETHILCRERV